MNLYLTLEEGEKKVERIIKIKMLGGNDAIMPDINEITFDMINTINKSKKPL